VVDLTRGTDELFEDLKRTSRTQVRRIERLGDQIEVRRNDGVDSDFLTVYNGFVGVKQHSEKALAAQVTTDQALYGYFRFLFSGPAVVRSRLHQGSETQARRSDVGGFEPIFRRGCWGLRRLNQPMAALVRDEALQV